MVEHGSVPEVPASTKEPTATLLRLHVRRILDSGINVGVR